jgi:hypothetical protein
VATQLRYAIALDPTLGLDPVALATAWNGDPTTAPHGTMQISAAPAKGFDFAGMGLEFVSGLTIGLITNYLYDLIVKGAYATKPTPPPTLTIRTIDQPDGTKLIVVLKE